ncbi:nuclease [Halomonas cupida]|uniref:Nuclease n=1 Tax=Halomonas cupida TaxID=44933 RepID=A0A1M7L309_9GAMM|nr:endonuclease/exonuclease/phosphatase family protein [Halomonas cupida]GEN26212.1 nuclease [Halomonas cupida]SHM72345.1 Endonuclease/Exonuclease/phosphatase family protein [Halomonas cupida]
MASFKVGTFNLYNLVLPGHHYYGDNVYSQNLYDRKREWIRQRVQNMEAEIIGFQEVFQRQALIEALEGTEFSPEQVHVLGEDGSSPVVGLASRFELIDEPQSIREIPAAILDAIPTGELGIREFSRPPLKTRIVLPEGHELTVLVCHLKSKRPMILSGEDEDDFLTQALGSTRSLLRRSIEAAGIRHLALEAMADNDAPLMVIGDLNDATHSVTTQIMAGPHPWKFDPRPVKERHWDRLLYSSFDIIAQRSLKNQWPTYIYNGRYEELDHILVSQEFYFRNPDRIGDMDYVHVLDDQLKDDTLSRDRLPRWKSDHGQVVATFRLREERS